MNPLNLILIISTTLLSFIVFLLICYLYLLDIITKICDKIRWFISENESFFDISFLIIFSLEQVLLLYLIFRLDIINKSFQLAIGIFVITVIGTATLQKIVLNVRYKLLKDITYELDTENVKIRQEHKFLSDLLKVKKTKKKS